MKLVRALALLAVVGAPAGAQITAPAGDAAATTPAPAKKICRRESPTGSIMPPKRVCWTPEQWAVRQAQMAKGVDLWENRGQRAGPPE